MKKFLCVVLVFLILFVGFIFLENSASPSQNIERQKPAPAIPLPEEAKVTYEMLDSDFISELEAENDASTFPALWGDYTKHLGFAVYMREMEKCGAVCFFLSKTKNVFLRINYANSTTQEFSIEGFASKWGNTPAKIQGEESLAKFMETSDTEIFLAKPLAMERKIEGVVRNYLNGKQIKIKDILTIKAEYFLQNGNFCLRVYEILYRDSSLQKVDIIISLLGAKNARVL